MLPHLAEYFGVDQEDGKAFGYILTNYLAANALVGQMMLNKPPWYCYYILKEITYILLCDLFGFNKSGYAFVQTL